MTKPKLVAFAGSYNRPSRTVSLLQEIADRAALAYGFSGTVHDLGDVGPSLGAAQWPSQLDETAAGIVAKVTQADLVVIGSPTFKGSYPGLFKHFVDLIQPEALRGKPVLIAATGGGDRHALMVEHQLRPLFGFFMAHTLPTAVYASTSDFQDYRVAAPALSARIDEAIADIGAFFPRLATAIAAE
ncbi:FMN reductase [Aureimonas altamirensis]|uniref:FMN reductase n=1 Tax=Aureimonas altamirensis TaxID=370622 RepID=UPI00203742C8|nr:FMN reductase [Aureimonas altamirensis]MCM2503822.1 FMN reductase [Aureimonas altamirensis]